MPTFIPPSSNELLDQDAIVWAVGQGHIFWRSTSDYPAPPGDRIVWNADMVRTYIYGPNTAIPKAGGGTYASNECPTYADILAWGYNNAPPPPPDPAPDVAPANFNISPLSGRQVKFDWTNPTGMAGNSITLQVHVGEFAQYYYFNTAAANTTYTATLPGEPTGVTVYANAWYYNSSGSGPAASDTMPTLFS